MRNNLEFNLHLTFWYFLGYVYNFKSNVIIRLALSGRHEAGSRVRQRDIVVVVLKLVDGVSFHFISFHFISFHFISFYNIYTG